MIGVDIVVGGGGAPFHPWHSSSSLQSNVACAASGSIALNAAIMAVGCTIVRAALWRVNRLCFDDGIHD